jgi:hypothetical protein
VSEVSERKKTRWPIYQRPTFWKVWRSTFVNKNKPLEVDGWADVNIIVNKLANYFAISSATNNVTRAVKLQDDSK